MFTNRQNTVVKRKANLHRRTMSDIEQNKEDEKNKEDPMKNKPEDNFFQDLSVGSTIARAFYVFGKACFTFLGISLMTGAAGFVAASLLMLLLGAAGYAIPFDDAEQKYSSDIQLYLAASGTIELLILYLFQCVAEAAIVRGVAEIYSGQEPSILPCFWAAWSKACSLLSAFFIAVFSFILIPFGLIAWTLLPMLLEMQHNQQTNHVVITAVAVTLFGVYIFIVSLLTYVMYPAIIVENYGPITAIGRSIYLTKDNLCYTFCTLFFWAILKIIINVAVTSLSHLWIHDDSNITANYDSALSIGNLQFDVTFGSIGDGALAFVVGIVLVTMGSM